MTLRGSIPDGCHESSGTVCQTPLEGPMARVAGRAAESRPAGISRYLPEGLYVVPSSKTTRQSDERIWMTPDRPTYLRVSVKPQVVTRKFAITGFEDPNLKLSRIDQAAKNQ